MVRDLWNELTVKSPADLITEARGYGYPLRSLVDFYIKRMTCKEELQDVVEYLQEVDTWADFAQFMKGLKDEPPKDIFPTVPNDLVVFIIDNRIKSKRRDETIAHAENMTDKEVIAYLGFETLRKHKGVSIEKHALNC